MARILFYMTHDILCEFGERINTVLEITFFRAVADLGFSQEGRAEYPPCLSPPLSLSLPLLSLFSLFPFFFSLSPSLESS